MAEAGKEPLYPVRAVERVCDILDTLANSPDGVTLTEATDATELPKSSVFRYLAALERRHYVERDADRVLYRLGPAFRTQDNNALIAIAEAAAPHLSRLCDELEETTNLGVLDGVHVLHQSVFESPHMMRLAARVGERGFVHSTALGKALCATLPKDRVHSMLAAAGMPRFTDTTVTDEAAYFAELERVATLGYGLDDEENQLDGRCVGVVIPNCPVPAGISVSAPVNRLPVERIPQIAERLTSAAAAISAELHA